MKRIIAFLMLIVMAVNSLAATPGYPAKKVDPEAQLLENKPEDTGSMDFKSFGLSKAGQAASSSLQGWLGQFGTAKVDLSGGSGFQSGAVDVLVPIYDTERHLFFTQVGARRSNLMTPSYRTTVNVGAGYRYFTADNWMYGANVFYDRDVTRKHQRIGLGGEAWTDFLKFSANAYLRASGWKTSPDLVAYNERPANGFDVRAEGFFPQYPQLGIKLMFEQYFGDEVGLFGVANRSKDPRALTVGASWTPIPLITTSLDHRMGQGGQHDTTFKFQFNYSIGVPLNDQLRADNVAETRKLKWSRYNLVERNNEIVLEYKKKPLGEIKLPTSINGNPVTVATFPVSIRSDAALRNFTWSGTAASFATPYAGAGDGSLALPAYTAGGVNDYQLQLQATDQFGRQVKSNVMNVTVNAVSITVARSQATAAADGQDSVTFTATLLDAQALPMVSRAVKWTIRNASLKASTDVTDKAGQATATVTSLASAVAEVTAIDATNGSAATADATFTGDPATAQVTALTAAPSIVAANGTAASKLTATVKDANGNTMGAGTTVTWSSTLGTLAASSSTTDANGTATVDLVSPITVGTATVTAKVSATGDAGKTATVQFIADAGTARVNTLTAAATSMVANGSTTTTLTATVVDANGNTVGAGVPVQWATTLGSVAAVSSMTNATGQATVVLQSGTAAGTATVSAKAAAGDAGKTVAVTFTGDPSTARVTSFITSIASAPANGTSPVTLTATVRDANGNEVGAGVAVNWTTTLGTLAAASTTTNAASVATVVLTAPTTIGTASLTAKAAAGDAGKTASVLYVADATTARVVSLSASQSTVTAGSGTQVTLTAVVKDANGNDLGAGIAVNWGASLGSLAAAATATDATGTATVVFTTPTTAGVANLTAKGSGSDPGKTAAITVIPDASTAQVYSLTPVSSTQPANGTGVTSFTANVRDAYGNIVGAGVAVTWSASLGTLAASTSSTDAGGNAVLGLTAPTSIGTSNVTAKAVASDPGKVASVQYVADTSTARVITLVASPLSVVADGSTAVTLTATVKDANGNTLGAGVTVNWTTTLGSLAGATSTTDSTGTATMTLRSTAAGAATVTAKGASGDAGKSAGVTFTANPATARVVSVSASPTSIVANGSSASVLTAVVRDVNGNALSGATVNWSASLGSLAAGSSTTNASGVTTLALYSGTTAGTSSVSAVAAATGIGAGTAVTFTPASETRYDGANGIGAWGSGYGAGSGGTNPWFYCALPRPANVPAPTVAYITWDGVSISGGDMVRLPYSSGGYTYSAGAFVGWSLDSDPDDRCDNGDEYFLSWQVIRTPN